MNQFTFTSRLRSFLIGAIVIGVICMALTFFNDDMYHTRFWSNLLHNSVFFTGISFMAVFFIAICITAYAGWHTLFKRVWEAFASFMIPGLILMVLIGISVYMHGNHLYHWAAEGITETDSIIAGKSGFLNSNWYLFGTIIIVGLWIFFARRLRSLSIQEDNEGAGSNFSVHRTMRKYAAIFLPIAGFSSAAVIWQWVMSVDAHWYSTLFAWYASSSWFVAMICLTILVLLYLKGKGYYSHVTNEHMHDLGKFLFAFSIFWTYLWFSQFMLIWYGNVGEETEYFKHRMDHYPILHYGNLLLNFILPFLVLMRNDTKRKYGSLGFVAAVVLLGHWWDYFQMLKPGIRHTAMEAMAEAGGAHHTDMAHGADVAHHVLPFELGFSIPGILELGTFIGFLGFFLYVVFAALGKAALVPKNDPYLEESMHHHT